MEFSFKPALIRSQQTWKVSDGILTSHKGEQWDLSRVSEARYVDTYVKGRWNSELLLKRGEDKPRLLCNDRGGGENRFEFLRLILAVTQSLKQVNPNLVIKRGLGRIANYAFACIGLIPIGFGLSILIDTLSRGFTWFGVGMSMFLMLMGVFLIWSAAPWKPAPEDTPETFEVWLLAWIKSSTGRVPMQLNQG